ncbi:hypothetical protein V6N13_144585 [Hibiscus sabdariffa]|uniref:Uncharacterized protein n=1 Tax=Hibiscus sabdariffa TaxID=183260 RepID=A0ABR2FKS6_9ROSI
MDDSRIGLLVHKITLGFSCMGAGRSHLIEANAMVISQCLQVRHHQDSQGFLESRVLSNENLDDAASANVLPSLPADV